MGIHTLSDALGGSGGPVVYTCSKGNEYKFSLFTLESQSKFERELERRAFEKVRHLKDLMDGKEYEKQIAEVMKSIRSGDFAFGKDECNSALSSLWGVTKLIAILGGLRDEQASSLVQENDDLKVLIETIIERSFPVMSKKKVTA